MILCAYAFECPRRTEEGTISPEAGVQGDCALPDMGSGTKLGSFGRLASALTCWATSLAAATLIYLFSYKF